MAFKISGFCGELHGKNEAAPTGNTKQAVTPRKSLVQVHFPGRGMALAYYNDRFDLKVGDRVYVDGKLEGLLGRVVDISYNFRIKLSDYKKVIAVVDTEVHGQFFTAGSHFIAFDPDTLRPEQVVLWFKAPAKEEDEFVSSTDDASFPLSDLKGMDITPAIAERGRDYYMDSRVSYLCLEGTHGTAIVEGSRNYTVEFEYRKGEISKLICECPCCYTCKHEVAVMLQLKETLERIEKNYAEEFTGTGYFAAIEKSTLFTYAISRKETGSISL